MFQQKSLNRRRRRQLQMLDSCSCSRSCSCCWQRLGSDVKSMVRKCRKCIALLCCGGGGGKGYRLQSPLSIMRIAASSPMTTTTTTTTATARQHFRSKQQWMTSYHLIHAPCAQTQSTDALPSPTPPPLLASCDWLTCRRLRSLPALIPNHSYSTITMATTATTTSTFVKLICAPPFTKNHQTCNCYGFHCFLAGAEGGASGGGDLLGCWEISLFDGR